MTKSAFWVSSTLLDWLVFKSRFDLTGSPIEFSSRKRLASGSTSSKPMSKLGLWPKLASHLFELASVMPFSPLVERSVLSLVIALWASVVERNKEGYLAYLACSLLNAEYWPLTAINYALDNGMLLGHAGVSSALTTEKNCANQKWTAQGTAKRFQWSCRHSGVNTNITPSVMMMKKRLKTDLGSSWDVFNVTINSLEE